MKNINNTQQQVIDELVAKTMEELSSPNHPLQSTRAWAHPEGYKYLVQWSNAVLLRYLVRKFTASLPKAEFRQKPQLDDAARSVVRNIEEGYKRGTTSPYLEFISFSQGSLEEIKGDIRDVTQDGFLKSKPGSSLAGIGVNLKAFHDYLTSSKSPLPSFTLKEPKGGLKDIKTLAPFNIPLTSFKSLDEIYPPLAKINASDLTYEIFLELINKTDYLLRVLVQSLEKKLVADKKGYQIDQARIRDRLKIKR